MAAPPSLLIISPCSSLKHGQHANAPTFSELSTPTLRRRALTRWRLLRLPARELYRGRHHLTVLHGLSLLRSALPDTSIRLAIVSAGYGLLDEYDPTVPYDASFSDLSTSEAIARARRLGIRSALEERLASTHTAIFLLSDAYLTAIEAPLDVSRKELYFASPAASLPGKRVIHIEIGRGQARLLADSPRTAKATLFAAFTQSVTTHGWDRAMRLLTDGALFSPSRRAAPHPAHQPHLEPTQPALAIP